MGNQLLAMLNIIYYTFYFKHFKALKLPVNQFFALQNEKNTRDTEDKLTCDCDEIKDITRRINPCSDWFCIGVKELKRVFNEHVQPPLDYYIKIISKNPTKSIIIVHDSNIRKPHWRNPVLDKLIEYIETNELKNVKIQSTSIREDMAALCCSKTIICAMGTFSFMCYIISPITQQIYIPHYMINKKRGKNWFVLNEEDKDVVNVIDISSYIKVGSWKNKPEQRELMLNYKMNENELEKLSIDI
jgi:hypothetical protein